MDRILPPEKEAAIPVHVMDFKLGSLVKEVKTSLALQMPFQCSSSGVVLVHMIDPASESSKGADTFLEITGDHGVRLDTSPISDIDIETVDNYSFSGTHAILTVFGRRRAGSTVEKLPLTYFLACFAPTGQYEKSLELNSHQVIQNVGALPTGDFVLSSHNLTNRLDTLAIYDASGMLDRPLDQPMTAKERESDHKQGNPTAFVSHGDNAIAYRLETRNAILEIGQKIRSEKSYSRFRQVWSS